MKNKVLAFILITLIFAMAKIDYNMVIKDIFLSSLSCVYAPQTSIKQELLQLCKFDISQIVLASSVGLSKQENKEPAYTPPITPTPSPISKTISASVCSISNDSKYEINMDKLQNNTNPFKITSSPQILILHTHTTESYTMDRTTDNKKNVARVGYELYEQLKKRGLGVIYNDTQHDYPSYTDSYENSANTAYEILKKYPDIKIIVDIHRDALNDSNGNKIKFLTNIDGKDIAQVMLVVGTDGLGLSHPNWETNLRFANILQKEFLSQSPTFARPINLRDARFNGHLAPGAIIIEVGTSANTLEEALNSTPYIANALKSVVDKLQ